MENKIEDYLHLYIGCQGKISDGIATINNVDITGVTIDQVNRGSFTCNPILRPLSDMTEEEKMQLIRICHPEKEYPIIKYIDLDKEVLNFSSKTQRMKYYRIFACGFYGTWHPEEMKYLLKQGFDLFGLIESGLAIDKTKLNK